MLTRTIASTATIKLAGLPMLDLFYTPLEERFERITRIARHALGVPVAAVTLMNAEKQWFKSVSGWTISELPRDLSLCQTTLKADEPNFIADTTADPRTSRHPLVVSSPRFRFYAGHPLSDSSGLVAGTFCVFDIKARKISEAERQCFLDLAALAQRELTEDHLRSVHVALTGKLGIARREAMMDPLTRVWNRRGAMVLLESAFKQADRKGGRIGLALLDVDNFKQVNDTLGHQVGDEVLRKITARIVANVRDHDITCRIGGDEFLLLVADGDSAITSSVAERVRRAITDSPIPTRRGSVSMTASAGLIVREPGEALTMEEIIERSDRALMQSKRAGRNRVNAAS